MKKFTLSLLFCFGVALQAQTTKSALFLGNSYTQGNNLPQLVSNIAESFGDTLIHDKNTPGGHQLSGHATNPTSQSKIKQGNWDYVVLQDQSQKPSFDTAFVNVNCRPYAKALSDSIYKYNSCAQPLFFMTWGRKNGDAANCGWNPPSCTYLGMQGRLRSSYLIMGQDNNAPTSPVGAVWRDFRAAHPNVELYTGDESHPNMNGSYLAACTFYASIFHKSPVGAWKPTNIDSTLAHNIQSQANATVFDSVSVWGIDTVLPKPHYSAYLLVTTQTKQTWHFVALDSANADSATWNFGNGITGKGDTISNSYTQNGVYQVTLTVWKNCTAIDSTFIIQVFPVCDIPENELNLVIAPNPATSEIRMMNQCLNYDYTIFNSYGQPVLSGKVIGRISVETLKEGVYTLIAKDNGKVLRGKFIKR
jgi:hypothetical protein